MPLEKLKTKQPTKYGKRSKSFGGFANSRPSNSSFSEDTIYKDAVPKKGRDSSSSEDPIDTSDEAINFHFEDLHIIESGSVVGHFSDDRSKHE